ncbi:unnamed protein product [Gongylonema pulchrum]|uniref:Uncharacterized protein n=1 Tax=Gongylonema pulchrum TaxID=637853 RepID=A0A183EKF6_9BILA|nr:unnamed protein product [Gongylonema pulchrum]
MWEGRPIDSTNGWPIFEKGGAACVSTSMVVSSSLPKLTNKENHINSLQHRRYSEQDQAFCAPDEMLVAPVQDDQVQINSGAH